jgi:branched-subunit amino acid aminotransferase/4-amino-4-deoxychorismate lyase
VTNDYIQANSNGRLHDAREPSLSPLDRGFLYGDAVYEVWRTYRGVLFAWPDHCERLERSAAALGLGLPWSREVLLDEIRRTVASFQSCSNYRGDLYVRLQVTRGGGPIGLDPALAVRPNWVLLVRALPAVPRMKAPGVRLVVARRLHRNPATALDPAWKTGNYLNNLLCLQEARARGGDEVAILNARGEFSEAAVSNLWFVDRAGTLLTPPLSAGILAGITRARILTGVAARAGLSAVERSVRPDQLQEMAECFLSSTTRDVTPVAAVDEVTFPVGLATVTARLKAAFQAAMAEEATAHPEWRVA